jgi:TRAP-type C4-dicarboxylate transport system permease small subunit
VIFLALERIATNWTRRLALLGGWLLLAVAIVTALDALLRDFLGRPLPGTFEATELVLAAIIFFGLPYASLTDGHVSVDFLTNQLGQRTQYALIAVNAIICAVLFGVITQQMMALAAEFLATKRTTITMRIPIFPCIVPVTVTASLAALGFVVQALGAVCRALRPGLPPLPTPHR